MKTRNWIYAMAATVAAFSQIGCAGDGGNQIGEGIRLLQMGDSWTMRGTITTGDVVQTYNEIVTVGQTELEGALYPLIGHNRQFGEDTPITWGDIVTQTSSNRDIIEVGDIEEDGFKHSINPRHTLLPATYHMDQEWTAVHDEDGDDHTITYRVIGTETITTPAGTFNCVKLRMTIVSSDPAHSGTGTAWLDPGLGYFVKTEEISGLPIGGPRTVEILQSTNVQHHD
jgi:hypothetical protein